MEEFGTRLSAARKMKGYTQEQLAEKLSVSRTGISRWESGRMLPDLATLKRISQVLDVDFFAADSETPNGQAQETVASLADEMLAPLMRLTLLPSILRLMWETPSRKKIVMRPAKMLMQMGQMLLLLIPMLSEMLTLPKMLTSQKI